MKNVILAVIITVSGLGIYGITCLIIRKIIKKKRAEIKEMLENPLKKEEAQKIIDRREKYSNKGLKFLAWYYPIFGFICIILGSVPIYFEIEKNNGKIIVNEIIKGILAVLLGLYFLINGIISLYKDKKIKI